MTKELEPAELLEELRGFDLVVLFDDELAPSLARPKGLTKSMLASSVAGVAFSLQGEVVCWSARDGVFHVEEAKAGETMNLRLDTFCSEDFQRLLSEELKLEIGAEERDTLTLSDTLKRLRGEEP